MRLEIKRVEVKEIKFGTELNLKDGVLTIDSNALAEEIKKVPGVVDASFDVALPGEKTRIIPVKDVIEPRVTISPEGVRGFSGVDSEIVQLGDGVVHALDNVAVVTIGDIVGFQEGVIDMWGEGAKWTPFSKTMNIVLDLKCDKELKPHEHEATVREAGLLAAELIGNCAKDAKKFKTVEVYEMGTPDEESKKYPNLPKVVYVEMLISQGLLHDSFVYGVNTRFTLPTILHANEELDGAVISGNCVAACDKITTYQHQNNSVIKSLYERHGKEINFVGVIIAPELTTLDGKFRTADFVAKICSQLGADGAIVSEEGYGNPDSDLVMIAERLEKRGIVTTLITDECSGWDALSQPLTDAKPEAKAVISTGNVSKVINLDKADKVLGDPEAIANLAGGWAGAYDSKTGKMSCELNAVIGATSEIGYHNCTIEVL